MADLIPRLDIEIFTFTSDGNLLFYAFKMMQGLVIHEFHASLSEGPAVSEAPGTV